MSIDHTSPVRVIPRLDIKGANLVKGIHLEGLRVLGQPGAFGRHYYESGADELVYMDVVASLYNRNSLIEFVQRISREVFIPLTVGGGLRSLDDIRDVLRAGADKVSLNTAVVKDPGLVKRASRRFGSSTIVVSIEAIQHENGTYESYTDNGRERTGLDPVDLGAGEILLTSINREGTGKGYDLELTRNVADRVGIPVIACGGAGRVEDVAEVIQEGRADAVCTASLLHYHVAGMLSSGKMTTEGNTEFLDGGMKFSKIVDVSLQELKQSLRETGIVCRK